MGHTKWDKAGGTEGQRGTGHEVGVRETGVAETEASQGRLPAAVPMEWPQPRGNGRFNRTELVSRKAEPKGLPTGIEKGPEEGVVVSRWNTRKGMITGGGQSSCACQSICSLISGDTDVTGYPTKGNRLMADRQTEQPVLDLPDKGMGRVQRL